MNLCLRDMAPAQARSICGALVPESRLVFRALKAGTPLDAVRTAALDGTLFRQPSYQARRRFWHGVHARYLAHGVAWVVSELTETVGQDDPSPEALGLLYLHFVVRDRLTQDLVAGPIWTAWQAGNHALSRHTMMNMMEQVAPDFYAGLTEGTRHKLATSLLSALRDYGVCKGVQTKRLVQPVVPIQVVAHLLRLLVEEGKAGSDILDDPTWRAFLMTPDDVAAKLSELALSRLIRFERAGATIILETPWGHDET